MAESSTPVTDRVENKPSFPDPMSKMAFEQIVELTNQRNSLVSQINAVKGDPAALRDNLKENPPTPEIQKLKDAWDKAQEAAFEAERALEKAVAPKVEELRANAEASVADREKQADELEGKVRAATNYFKKVYEKNTALIEALPKLDRKHGGTSRTGVTGSKRVRGYTFDVTVGKDTTGYENLSSVAKELTVETKILQDGFFKAAGTGELKDAPAKVEWSQEVGDGDKKQTVKIVGSRVVKDEETAAA